MAVALWLLIVPTLRDRERSFRWLAMTLPNLLKFVFVECTEQLCYRRGKQTLDTVTAVWGGEFNCTCDDLVENNPGVDCEGLSCCGDSCALVEYS